jgi:hypothetical protein
MNDCLTATPARVSLHLHILVSLPDASMMILLNMKNRDCEQLWDGQQQPPLTHFLSKSPSSSSSFIR